MTAGQNRPLVIHVATVPLTLWFLRGQVRFLQRAGLDVLAVSSPGPLLTGFRDTEGARIAPLPMRRAFSPLADLVALVRLWLLFRRERPSIVDAHTPKAGLLAMAAAWLGGVPIRVFHLHGLPHTTAAGIRRWVLVAATRLSCRFASRVLPVSGSVRRLAVEERLCPAGKAVVLAGGSVNGVDCQFFKPDAGRRDEFRRRLGLKPGELAIGFAGRIVPDKGLAELQQAWQTVRRDFPGVHLVLAGDLESPTPLPPGVLAPVSGDSRVHWLGWQSDMRNFYAGIDLLVLPSYREGLPTVILEAAATGIPAVTTDAVGCVDTVIDGITGAVVPARDAEALAQAISTYVAAPELRAAHGAAARSRVQACYRPETLWHATLAEYQALAAARETRGKRTFDIVAGALLLILAAPWMLLVAAAVGIATGAPVLFRQRRSGRGAQPIEIWKFRTMTEARDQAGRLLPDEQRLTRLGRFLRATSLDELPQLWNVLRGDMSLVGPRPLLPKYLPLYSPRQARRHEVRPGITGWSQVNGRNAIDWTTRLELDVWYVDHRSLWLDLKILLKTAATLVRRSGVSHGGHATMPEFRGEVRAQ
jgi:lipopolysaccharide/colanic/teichoic acid biosynthesis glycosyltransferase